jgi:uncharacterized membrane protein
MVTERTLSRAGIYVYGAAAICLGVIGLVWGDFAMTWQRVPADVPYREALAYMAAVWEICAGVAILLRQSARTGALLLTMLYSLFALSWLFQIASTPLVYDPWGNLFEELSLVIAGLVVYASLAPRGSIWAGKTAAISRSYGICVISFALVHIVYFSAVVNFIPKWIPGHVFWAVTTTACFLMAAFAILSGILAGLASRLLTAMIVGFEVLAWAPQLFDSPHVHFVWSGNGICLAMAGAAWVVFDSITGREGQQEVDEASDAGGMRRWWRSRRAGVARGS